MKEEEISNAKEMKIMARNEIEERREEKINVGEIWNENRNNRS